MLKRYPPICDNSTPTELSKPLFVQLMLVERDEREYHRSLLQTRYDHNDSLKLQFIKSPTETQTDCTKAINPSALPGTLFMLNYNIEW